MAKRVRGLYKRGKVWWCCYKDINERVLRVTTGTSDYDNAIDFIMNRRKEVKAGIEPERKKIINHTFNELTEEYKKWCERQKSYYSKIHLINQLKEKFRNIPLRRFNSMLIEQYQTERIKQGIWNDNHKDKLKGNKPATVNRCYFSD